MQTLLTPKEVASVLTISRLTLERWRSRGYGPNCMKIGHRWVYSEEDVRSWLKTQQHQIEEKQA